MNVIDKIQELKQARNAVILAHNYQIPEVQDIADFCGDSLELSIRAGETDADIIVFCGVRFMAETAKIISPDKTVLLPDRDAGCPMADMITREELAELKRNHPGAKVICYVNTTAETKAESDICCTSSNAVDIVGAYFRPEEEVIFVPDRYLMGHVADRTGKEFIPWNGYCPTHARILPEDIIRQKELHPRAETLVHPECRREVARLADRVLSTGGMARHVRESVNTEFIIGTETGILHRLQRENPQKTFHPASLLAVCPNMKKITLEKVLWALQETQHEITVPEDIISRSYESIRRMLDISG